MRIKLLFALLTLLVSNTTSAKPNIVLIFIDDLGYGDIGPFGSTKNRTPHLDRMAKEGMKLTSFYAAPVCSVSRAQVMTGCYGVRVSLPGVLFPGQAIGINSSEHTVAELLKAQGYATMCIGKWHLGDQPEFLPTRHGFDHYLGLPYSNDMIKKHKADGRAVVPLVRDDKVQELLDAEGQDGLTRRYTEEAVKFITTNKDKPFFLYLPHTAVHTPIHPGPEFAGKSPHGRFSDWVEEVDWSVGQIIDTLRKLQLDQNTLVIFSSDNGPWLVKKSDGGEAGPLRGGKGSTWEGGVRVPTIAWWPGKVAAGSTSDAVAGNIDFLPTFVSLAGGAIPTDNPIDGKDFSPILLSKANQSQREAHYYFHGTKLQAVRSGPWKLAFAPQNDGLGKGGAPIPASLDKPRLYNLDTDIGEQKDVAAEHPEVVNRLKALAVKMSSELGDGKSSTQVRAPGKVENPVTLYPTESNLRNPTSPAGKALPLDQLKPGDTLASDAAPQISDKPITISCELTTNAKDGVIVAHGGAVAGYALYLKNGHVVFTVRTSGQQIARISSPAAIAEKATIEGRLAPDGTMTLLLDAKPVASGKGALIKRQPAESFSVGHDDGRPVDQYDGATVLRAELKHLKIDTK